MDSTNLQSALAAGVGSLLCVLLVRRAGILRAGQRQEIDEDRAADLPKEGLRSHIWQYILSRLLYHDAQVLDASSGGKCERPSVDPARNRMPPRPTHFVLRPEADPRIDQSIFVRYDPVPERKTGKMFIVCPGGNYDESDIWGDEGQAVGQWLARLGITAVVLQYRVVSRGFYWPSQFEDWCACAQAIQERAATWDCDASQVGVIGFSAGGHLASYAATSAPEPLRPKLQVLVYPSIDTTSPSDGDIDPWYADRGYPPKEASPHLLVDALTPPAFLAGIDNDSYCPPNENIDVYAGVLQEKGLAVETVRVPDAEHGCGVQEWWSGACEEWLRSQGWIHES